jgi:hypothetical protein
VPKTPLLVAATLVATAALVPAAAQAQAQTCAPGQSPPYCEQVQSPLTPNQQQSLKRKTLEGLRSSFSNNFVRAPSTSTVTTPAGFITTAPSMTTVFSRLTRGLPLVSASCILTRCRVSYRTTLTARVGGRTVRLVLKTKTVTIRVGNRQRHIIRLTQSQARRFAKASRITAQTVVTTTNPATGTRLSRVTRTSTVKIRAKR